MRISDWSSDVCSSDLKAALTYRLRQEYRHNSLDPETGVVTLSDRRARAIALTDDHSEGLYGADPVLRQLRDDYAMKEQTLPDPAKRAPMTDFFYWTRSEDRLGGTRCVTT